MNRKAILLVDDEKIILDSLKMQLKENFGNKIFYEIAESVNEALEIIDDLHNEKIGEILVISDWLMPEIKGDQFLIDLHRKFPKVIKVMLTGQADEKAINNAYKNANLYTCIQKPWKEEEMLELVKKVFGIE